ncbi:VanW family protein [Streptomyces sp. YJ-C3]
MSDPAPDDISGRASAGRGGRGRRTAWWAGAAAVLVLGALYVVGLLRSGDDIPEGTQVQGVDIGGMSRTQAAAALEKQRGDDWSAPVAVRIGDTGAKVDPAAAGLTVDAAATARDAAGSRDKNPVAVIGGLFGSGGRSLDPVVRVDGTKARAALKALAEGHDTSAEDAAIAFRDGTAVATQPRQGRTLDVDRAATALRAAYAERRSASSGDARPADLPTKTTQPAVGQDELDRAMKELATPAVSGPVKLTTGAHTIEVSPAALGAHLTVEPGDDHRFALRLDGQGLLDDPSVARSVDRATDGPVEARLRLDGDRVVVASDGRPGRTLTAASLHKAVLPLLAKTGDRARTAPVATEAVQPRLTKATVEKLGITRRMSTFTVNFEPAPYRTTNIGRAAELINGSLVPSDAVWSFNRTVGERTKENGFVDGTMIQDGSYEKAPGGGVSAVATTMFNAIFFAGVQPLEHGAHSFYIERYPEGREATVAWGTLDLSFRNDSGHALYILANATDTSVTITFLGTPKYDDVESVTGPRTRITQPKERTSDSESCVPQPPLEGFDVAVDRVMSNGGEEVKRETFRTHYTPRDKVTCE